MTSSTALWEAWKLAKAYGTTPSDLYGVTDELAAWSFNRAVWHFGTSLEGELKAAQEKAKNDRQAQFRQMQVMQDWGLGAMKFRDPAGGASKPSEAREGAPKEPAGGTVSSTTQGPVSL